MVAKTVKFQQSETEIAVLKTQVANIEEKVGELKSDIKELHECLDRNAEATRQMLSSIHDADVAAHEKLAAKVSALEKWRWMLMGAGIVIGSLGFDVVAKLLK